MKTTKVFVDMDGVLTDFDNDCKRWLQIPLDTHTIPGLWDTVPEYCRVANIETVAFWTNLNITFWSQMSWMHDGHQILELLENCFRRENICILSSPANAICAHGKIMWLKEHLPWYYRHGQYLLGPAKHFVSHSGTLLIDDRDKNVTDFEREGGSTYLIPRHWNRDYLLADKAVDYLERYLQTAYGK